MEQKTINEKVLQKSEEIIDGVTGKDTRERIADAAQRESPLDEARRLNKETKELVTELDKVKKDLTELAAFSALSGRGYASVPVKELTPEEIKKGNVNAYANALMAAM